MAKHPRAHSEHDYEWFWCQGYRSCSGDQSNDGHQPFKKLAPPQVTSLPFDNEELVLICQMDGQWSYVGNKKNQSWLFYAREPCYQRVIAHIFGRRTKKTLKKLIKLVKPYKFRFYCTDDWKTYGSELPAQSHIISKKLTQSIERNNLTLRTRLKRLTRRTLLFSLRGTARQGDRRVHLTDFVSTCLKRDRIRQARYLARHLSS